MIVLGKETRISRNVAQTSHTVIMQDFTAGAVPTGLRSPWMILFFLSICRHFSMSLVYFLTSLSLKPCWLDSFKALYRSFLEMNVRGFL